MESGGTRYPRQRERPLSRVGWILHRQRRRPSVVPSQYVGLILASTGHFPSSAEIAEKSVGLELESTQPD